MGTLGKWKVRGSLPKCPPGKIAVRSGKRGYCRKKPKKRAKETRKWVTLPGSSHKYRSGSKAYWRQKAWLDNVAYRKQWLKKGIDIWD